MHVYALTCVHMCIYVSTRVSACLCTLCMLTGGVQGYINDNNMRLCVHKYELFVCTFAFTCARVNVRMRTRKHI